jgi:DNA-binding response OmpR family regulator
VTKKTILLIDESHVVMDLIKRTLERAGYSVRCAGSLAGARELLAEYTPDGIVLEKNLPDGNGLDYCRELREKSVVPILFFSDSGEDELPALQTGANDFLKKPYDFEVLKARIGIMLCGAIKKEDF